MSYHTIAVQKVRHIVPDEAQAIADELRAIADQAEELAAQLRAIGGNLESGWEGRSQARFFNDFSSEPSVGETNATWVEGQAQRAESIAVTVRETVWETVWLPDV